MAGMALKGSYTVNCLCCIPSSISILNKFLFSLKLRLLTATPGGPAAPEGPEGPVDPYYH